MTDPKSVFQTVQHSAEEVRTWKNPRHHRPQFTEFQNRLAALEPLPTDPPQTDAARELIKRFNTTYAFDSFTRVPATASVTSLAKKNASPSSAAAPLQRKLDLPTFFHPAAPKPTDIGNATHTLLQHFDFAPGAKSIEDQISALTAAKLLSVSDACLVDRPAIQWFLQTDLAKLLAANHTTLIREAPFALMQSYGDSPATDIHDQMMIRGRIDLMIPTPAGLTVIDYKTDNITAAQVPARAESYSRQMQLYAQAIEKVARQKVSSIHLVFLTPRTIHQVL